MKTDYTKWIQNGRLLRGCRQEYSPVNFKEIQQIFFTKPGKTLLKLKASKDPPHVVQFATLTDIAVLPKHIIKSPQDLQKSKQLARL